MSAALLAAVCLLDPDAVPRRPKIRPAGHPRIIRITGLKHPLVSYEDQLYLDEAEIMSRPEPKRRPA